MNRRSLSVNRQYQLVLLDESQEPARSIVFEAPGPACALFRAEKECRGREAELFEDGRSLGRIKCAPGGGFWVLTPAAVIKSAA